MRRLCVIAITAIVLINGCQLLNFKPKSVPFYTAVLDRYPQNSAVVYLQAQESLNQGQYADALNRFAYYTELVPGDVRGWLGIGQCQLELGQFSKAEMAFRHAEVVARTPAGIAGLASSILMQGRASEAKGIIDKDGAQIGDNANLARVQGDIALAEGNPNEALAHYQKSVSISPVQPELRKRIQDLQDYLTIQR